MQSRTLNTALTPEKDAVVFSEFIENFKSSFFDHNHRHHAKLALRNLRQTGTVLTYTQNFNSHARTIGWDDAPIMSLYQHGMKEDIQLAVVMSNIQFTSLQEMQAMTLKAGQTIEGIQTGCPALHPTASTSTPTQWTSQHSGRIQATKSLMLRKLACSKPCPLPGSLNFKQKSIESVPAPAPATPNP
ncbi:uncharacterized protein VP01_1974g9 [Puccinia sorghi]|uniref:Retrotransposon gag domain-containing protein n=1 Tax=Puccinia sorghi TaxID=27349 RepID=A0A0L6VBY1_9BASI|nr:uncharacterized protein VP01_1974g9 [Puccinia sorghi]